MGRIVSHAGSYLNRQPGNQASGTRSEKQHRHPGRVAMEGSSEFSMPARLVLVELDLFHIHVMLAVLFGNGSGHAALLGALADIGVILLDVFSGEPVNGFLIAVLDLDDGV